jgi:hypothetical protein
MNIRIPFALRFLAVLAILTASFTQAVHAAPLPFGFNVSQLGANGSDPSYEIQLAPLPIQVIKVTAPDGSIYTQQSLQTASPTAATFADLSAHFFGTWTIDDQFGGSALSQYQFTFSLFSLDVMFHEVPNIVSPLDGATVNNPFDVHWVFPSGAVRSAITISLQGARATFTPVQTYYTTNITSALPAQVQVRAGTFSSLSPYLSSITPVGQPGPDTFFYAGSSFRDLSPSISVNVVPEPGSLLLAVTGAILVAIFLNRNRRIQAI